MFFLRRKPLNIRAKAMSLSVASNWLWNFGIGEIAFSLLLSPSPPLITVATLGYATPYLVDPSTVGQVNGVRTAHLGVKVFFIWGSTCFGCFVFT